MAFTRTSGSGAGQERTSFWGVVPRVINTCQDLPSFWGGSETPGRSRTWTAGGGGVGGVWSEGRSRLLLGRGCHLVVRFR